MSLPLLSALPRRTCELSSGSCWLRTRSTVALQHRQVRGAAPSVGWRYPRCEVDPDAPQAREGCRADPLRGERIQALSGTCVFVGMLWYRLPKGERDCRAMYAYGTWNVCLPPCLASPCPSVVCELVIRCVRNSGQHNECGCASMPGARSQVVVVTQEQEAGRAGREARVPGLEGGVSGR